MKTFVYLILCSSVCFMVHGRLAEQIYLKLDDVSQHCYVILNGTHQVGCQSNSGGNIGVVVYYDGVDSFSHVISKFDTTLDLIIAINLKFFNKDSLKFLSEERVKGVLILIDNSSLSLDLALSEDSTCPSREFNLYSGECQKEWNFLGALVPEGLRFMSFLKPIFLIRNTTVLKIIKEDCFIAFNVNGSAPGVSLCSAKLIAHMAAAGNAEICMKRSSGTFGITEYRPVYCNILEDYNVIAVIPPPEKTAKKQKFFLITSRMDSFSSFANTVLGEISVLNSLISLIAVTEAIGKHLKKFEEAANRSHHSLAFSFFHGESLGMIGSSRVIFDMSKGEFPVKLEGLKPDVSLIGIDDIDSFLEVQSISGASNLFVHVDGESYFNHFKNAIDGLIDAANKKLDSDGYSSSISLLKDLKANSQLPPSSFQMFLKKKRSIAGFVLASFGSHYDYKRMNSFADRNKLDDKNSTITQILASATAILGATLKYVYGTERVNADFRINDKFVETLYDCFILSPDWQTCNLFQEILREDRNFTLLSPSVKKLKETSIGTTNQPSVIRLLVQALLVYTLGSKDLVNVNSRKPCEDLNKKGQLYLHTWQRDPGKNVSLCYRNSMYITVARSPAFDISGYDFKSGQYSTWVESQWSLPEMVLFLTPPYRGKFDLLVLTAGCVWLALSCVFVEIVYRSNKQFFDPPTPSPEADKTAAPL